MKYYVDANAPKSGNGSIERPFRRISEAAKLALPGDEVLVAPGIYREYVDPAHSGAEDSRITYISTTPLGAVITGAEQVKTWKHYQETSGSAASPTALSAITTHTRPWYMAIGILLSQTSTPAVFI